MKRICLLLIIAVFLICFFAEHIHAVDYQTSIMSPRQDKAEAIITSCPQTVNEGYLIIQDKSNGIYHFSANVCNEVKYVKAKEGLNLRTFPNTKYDNVVETLPYGTKVQLIGLGNGWAIVKKDGKNYFCWDEFLSSKKVKATITTKAEYTAEEFIYHGVIDWGGWRWTWYSQNVLPGGALEIPGRHVDENGYVCDENGYICLASSVLEKGTVLDTPFGKQGKIYDSGCAADTLDVYTNF